MNRRRTGTEYEELAAERLKALGYEILERNAYCRQGEIDIVAEKDGFVIFVEVKYRRTKRCGAPEEAVDRRKQARLKKAAEYYLYSRRFAADTPCRFDVVSIEGKEIRIWEDAFWI